jgi:7-cyano-7-deazaguanine synthase
MGEIGADDRGGNRTDAAERAVVLVSGGMDSATAVYEAIDRGYDPLFFHVSYGQRTAEKERECARRLANTVDATDFLAVDVDHLAGIGGSSLTDRDIEVEDADLDSEDVPRTYVPFRNANLLAMATAYAEASGASAVFIGAHSEDFSGYPDCRPAFFEAFQDVIEQGTKPESDIELQVPFAEGSKTDILRRGLELSVPYEHTWSCYRSAEPACGTCDACAYRLQAFERAGERDPIAYETRPEYA